LREEVNPLAHDGRTVTEPAPVVRVEHREALLTRMLEHQAARVPSHVFLFAAFCAMAVSSAAELGGRQRASRFIGMWVGPLLTMGVYNKLVKTFGAR
jgi:hypothetical protein